MAKSEADLRSAREYMRRRRAAATAARKAAKASGEAYEEPTLLGVFENDNGICYLCGCDCDVPGGSRKSPRRPTMDHVLALSNGGLHNYANLRLCCFACNRKKSADLVEEYQGQLATIA